MLLDVSLDKETLSIDIEKPFEVDLDAVMIKIGQFALLKEKPIDDVDIRGLIPKLIRGIAGCESGCPSNAKSLVRSGFANFKLEYIEGGILSAQARTKNGIDVHLKMFPEF